MKNWKKKIEKKNEFTHEKQIEWGIDSSSKKNEIFYPILQPKINIQIALFPKRKNIESCGLQI